MSCILRTESLRSAIHIQNNRNQLKEKDYYHIESNYGSFQRTVELPAQVKAEEATATYKDGILQIELPKTGKTKKKKIKIDVK